MGESPDPSGERHADVTELVALAQGRLSRSDADRVRQHLDTCDACRKRFDECVDDEGFGAELRDARTPQTGTKTPENVRDPVESPVTPMTGEKIPGYRVVREISRGGQAATYLAVQESTGQNVAVKVMHSGPFASTREHARFEREVRILATLRHPHIVSIIDCGTTEAGWFYIIMDYVEGHALDQWLDDYRRAHPPPDIPTDPVALLRLFMQICEAVEAAHTRGIVHRDLKPTNIRVDADGEPHVLDFGLARVAPGMTDAEGSGQSITMSGQFLGSLPWASPEQAEGNASRIDVRSDVYTLGLILYQMLTAKFPYEVSGSMRDVLDNIMTAAPTPPSQIIEARLAKKARRRLRRGPKGKNPINPTIEAIVLKALAKKPRDRYASAGELGGDVASYLSGGATLATARRSRRIGWRHAVIGGAAVLGCTLAALIAIPDHSQPSAADAEAGAVATKTPPQPRGAPATAPARRETSRGPWSLTGSLNQARESHTATLLPDGRVLVTSGRIGQHRDRHLFTNTCELYDRTTGKWTLTGALNGPGRYRHRSILLPTGKVLVVGGVTSMVGDMLESTRTCELYDPVAGTWTRTGDLAQARQLACLVPLDRNRVLATGGADGLKALASCEIYDVATGKWSPTGSLEEARDAHVAMALPGGGVLAAGGWSATCERYDPESGSWSILTGMQLQSGHHRSVALRDGRFLIAGGWARKGEPYSWDIYDPLSDSLNPAAPLGDRCEAVELLTLQTGEVLCAGGGSIPGEAALAKAWLYQPPADRWASLPPMLDSRIDHTLTLLKDGRVLVAGGAHWPDPHGLPVRRATCELYDPSRYAPPPSADSAEVAATPDQSLGQWERTESLKLARDLHSATVLLDGKVLVAGGRTGIANHEEVLTATCELYDPATRKWSPTGSFQGPHRYNHRAILLPDGRVLAVGGVEIPYNNAPRSPVSDACDLYSPTTGTWSSTGSLHVARTNHSATLLNNGHVLVVGALSLGLPLAFASCMIRQPGSGAAPGA